MTCRSIAPSVGARRAPSQPAGAATGTASSAAELLLGRPVGQVPGEEQAEQRQQRDPAEGQPEAVELRVAVVRRDGVGLVGREAGVRQELLDLRDRDDLEALLARRRGKRRPHLGGELLVRRDPIHEPVRQADQQDRADERGPERRAEVLGRALEAAGLVRLRGWGRRDDHVPELRCEQPGPDAEHRESDQEADVVQLDVEGREEDDGGERDRHQAEAAHGLRRPPGGDLRAGQRRDQHRHRHRQQAEAGLEGVEPEHDLEVDGQHEERPEQDQLLGAEGRQPGAQVDDPEQRGVEQSVATEPGEALLPGLEDEQEAEAARGSGTAPRRTRAARSRDRR